MKSVRRLAERDVPGSDQPKSRGETDASVRVWTRQYSDFAISYLQPLDRFVVHDGPTTPTYTSVAQIVRSRAPLYTRFVVESRRNFSDTVVEPFLELCVETTTKCNLRCRVCISESSPQASEFLDVSIMKQILAQCRLPLRVTLTGGEFFVRPDWRSVADYLLERGIGLVISTNGSLLNDLIVRHFIGAPVVFALSLDGLEKTHDSARRQPGSFQRVYSALLLLRDAGLPVHVYSVLQESNMEEMVHLSCSLAALGIVEHRIMYVVPRGRGAHLRVPFSCEVLENVRKLRLPHVVTVKTNQHVFPLLRASGELQWLNSDTLGLTDGRMRLYQLLGGNQADE